MIIGHIVCFPTVHSQVHFLIYCSLDDIMTSLLPDDAQGEIPVGFAIVGHIGISISPALLTSVC